ncbi:ABC transporter ATP-binding protein [Streptomyces sp. NPDC060035]|uniref:ABC transporter ATP-binding protein n=1 Tax=Streptomyces sp. NPDC060035 TaxID=3347044 RepID=UPI0036B1F6F4
MIQLTMERLRLLRVLSGARRGHVALLVVSVAAQSLLPAASSAALALLVRTLERPMTDTAGLVMPLAVFGCVLLAGHLLDVLIVPVGYAVKSRINGAHRASVARIATLGLDLGQLSTQRVQDLLQTSAADPQNWTEKTPGDGAVAQLTLVLRYFGAAAASVILAYFSWWLVPAIVLPALLVRARRRRHWLKVSQQWAAGAAEGRLAQYWKNAMTSAAAGKEMRVFGFADWAVQRMRRHLLALYGPVWSQSRRVYTQELWSFLLVALPLIGVYTAVAAATVHGRASIATEASVLAAAWAVFAVIVGISDAYDIESALPVLKAYGELTALAPQHTRGAAHPVLPEPGAKAPPTVTLTDVSFSYPGADQPVLDGLTLEIRPGEVLAIVGTNGAGKSTLIKLLAGLHQPGSGTITVDGTPLRAIPSDIWRARLAMVFQDFVRYPLTLRENILLGRPAGAQDTAALRSAVSRTAVGSLVARLPSGWETPLSPVAEDGVELSGGQWQHVALFRALYAVEKGARLVVLDEPTAQLDVRSELEVFTGLCALAPACSVVLISHRLSSVRQADRIVVLDNGRVAESGSHDALMERGGIYAEMFTIQAAQFTDARRSGNAAPGQEALI